MIEVEEREFSLQEVYEADECFFTDDAHLKYSQSFKLVTRRFGKGERGPITKKLQVAYEESIRLFKVTN